MLLTWFLFIAVDNTLLLLCLPVIAFYTFLLSCIPTGLTLIFLGYSHQICYVFCVCFVHTLPACSYITGFTITHCIMLCIWAIYALPACCSFFNLRLFIPQCVMSVSGLPIPSAACLYLLGWLIISPILSCFVFGLCMHCQHVVYQLELFILHFCQVFKTGLIIPHLCLNIIPRCIMILLARQYVHRVLCHSRVTHRCVNNCDPTHTLCYFKKIYCGAHEVVQCFCFYSCISLYTGSKFFNI